LSFGDKIHKIVDPPLMLVLEQMYDVMDSIFVYKGS